jgi:hypothetical protein
MKLSMIMCIVGASVALVCTCYGTIGILKIRKKEKAKAEKERVSTHLYLSTSWLMWADMCGVKVSNFTSIEESKYGFNVLFSKKSSDKIAQLSENQTIADLLKGHFEKLDSGKYQFVNDSVASSQQDVETLMLYFSMMAVAATEQEVAIV